jgi:hypothetical protein
MNNGSNTPKKTELPRKCERRPGKYTAFPVRRPRPARGQLSFDLTEVRENGGEAPKD